MAIRRNKKQNDETLVDIVEVKESASDWVDSNQKTILGALLGLVLVVGGFLAYKQFVKAPKEKEAMNVMQTAQLQFEKDSFALALSNPGNGALGFLDIADQYGGTAAGNLANYYIGVSYLRLGKYEAAIDHLKSFSADGSVLPATKFGVIGDAFAEKNDLDNALSYYSKAASAVGNEFTSSMYLKKVGLLNEKNQNWSAAMTAYKQIKTKYPLSIDGNDIDKYISRVAAKM